MSISPIWRHLTKPAGMTAQMLADATGMSIAAVRADLQELEALGKAARERGPIGKPHMWWRAEKKPMAGEDALLIIGLAAELHASPAKLRDILAKVGMRVQHKGLQKIIVMCANSKAPHAVVRLAIQEYEPEAFQAAQKAA